MMHELERDLGTVAMDPLGQLLESREIVVARERELAQRGCAAGIRDRADLRHDQADAASRTFFVVGDDRLAGVAIFLSDLDTHGRHRHAIAQLHAAEIDR